MKLIVNVNDKRVTGKLTAFSQRVIVALTRVMERLSIKIQADVKENRLSGQVLHVRTGTLRRSINREVKASTTSVTAIVGTNVGYAATHEFGLTIPAHPVEAKRAQALRFMPKGSGKFIFRKRVHILAVKMPERSFLRAALADFDAEIKSQTLNAVRGELP